VATQQQIGSPFASGDETAVRSVAFSPDGNILAAGYDDGVVRLWNVRYLTDVVSFLCTSAGGSFTPAEWAQYVHGPGYQKTCPALSPSAAAAPATVQRLTSTSTGTITVNLTTGAAISDFTGHLSPLGAGTGNENLTFTSTGSSTYMYTGSGTFVAANGDRLFVAITGEGTLTHTTAKSTETDTIIGGTGRFARANGTYTDTISSVVVSATSISQTSRFTAAGQGQIFY
jgi:WD40 repeat protein